MTGRAFIPDGYTETAFIRELPGVHEEIRFEFRPTPPRVVRSMMNTFYDKPADTQSDIIEGTLAKSIVSWDLKAPGGEDTLTVSIENFRKIKKELLDRFFMIVNGYDGGDLDPNLRHEQDDNTLAEYLSQTVDATGLGAAPLERRIEDSKNSEKG